MHSVLKWDISEGEVGLFLFRTYMDFISVSWLLSAAHTSKQGQSTKRLLNLTEWPNLEVPSALEGFAYLAFVVDNAEWRFSTCRVMQLKKLACSLPCWWKFYLRRSIPHFVSCTEFTGLAATLHWGLFKVSGGKTQFWKCQGDSMFSKVPNDKQWNGMFV